MEMGDLNKYSEGISIILSSCHILLNSYIRINEILISLNPIFFKIPAIVGTIKKKLVARIFDYYTTYQKSLFHGT